MTPVQENVLECKPSAPPAGARQREQSEAGSGIRIEGISVVFPNGFVGLKSTDLHVPAGSFCTLLGPSGSGKTTLLRAIAGLIRPSAGRIRIGERDVVNLPVQARNIGFVFQNYALFPHMSVAQNIDYPLSIRSWPRDERQARVSEVLELIELPHLADRAVGELSGGQQQRVAIGRALAYRPSLLLLDEPMGALDRRLRQQLGADLRAIQQQTGITAVYVTHDQEEAFILSDRIAIMADGEIQQYAEPPELYFAPRSRFVAEFLGEVNLIEARSPRPADGELYHVETDHGPQLCRVAGGAPPARAGLAVALRPEDILFTTADVEMPGHVRPIPVRQESTRFLGSRWMITLGTRTGQSILAETTGRHLPRADGDLAITWREDAAVLVAL